MSDRALSLTLAFLIPILFMLALPYSSSDLSVWITLGNFFLKTGTILRHDIFSVLPTSEMVYPSFGTSVLYGFLYRYLGLIGVCIFHAVVALPILLWILYRPLIQAEILPSTQKAKWVLFLFWLGGVPTFGERPSMIALIPLILSFQIIANFSNERIKTSDICKLIGLQILWANLHGSFILLPLMLGWKFFWLFLKTKKITVQKILLILGCALSAGFNPFQFKIYPYLLETARASKERGISEWDFPGLATQFPTGLLFWLMLIYTFYWFSKNVRKEDLWIKLSNPFFLFLLMGMFSIRNAALSFIVLLPGAFAAGFFQNAGNQNSRPSFSTPSITSTPAKRIANACVAVLVIFAIPLTAHFKPKKWDDDVAFHLVDEIKKDGRRCAIFNEWEVGGFLMLELPNPIYLDTRNIIYSRAEFQQYVETMGGGPNWDTFLKQGNACFVMVNPQKSAGLIQRLNASAEWEQTSTDGTHVLYAKKR